MGLNDLPIFVAMGINLTAFFVVCMVCHGELSAQQPHSQYLTTYCLMLAVGGVAGGFFVGVIAPYWFNENFELSIGILLTGFISAAVVISTTPFKNTFWKTSTIFSVTGFLVLIGVIRIADHYAALHGSELSLRNFYGTLKVYQSADGAIRRCNMDRSAMAGNTPLLIGN
ncbi:hypothetical protein [Polynucleobacter necessarius]|uniref:hypothetical protein n=1 Tax=Polynucleobacter necessarius TaxID=576610 RepID=UPI000E090396|nr:hypothetical protein [Polynucleobacter necessarius]